MNFKPALHGIGIAAMCLGVAGQAGASSHREAPFITTQPKVDATDFYMFRSYEAGRDGYTTIIANYQPLQDAYGGPNYFTMDPDALYEIHIDNNGDAVEDLTFQFQFTNTYAGITVNGETSGGDAVNNAIPLIIAGGVPDALGLDETYIVTLVTGDRRTGTRAPVTYASTGTSAKAHPSFTKPVDNIGNKAIPDYDAYASQYIYDIAIPGCATAGRMFVGQRAEGFVVNLGQVFDLINLNPLGARNSASNAIAGKNVTSLALELPTDCLVAGGDPVIGAWTTASKRQGRLLNPSPVGPSADSSGRGPSLEGGAWTQVSRLGSPLVNEVVIGVTDKDLFNTSEPKDDVNNFGAYVLYPTLPVLVEILFDVPPPATPRNDLLAAFVTGITANVNGSDFKFTAPANLTVPGEMLRLNTAIDPVVPGDAGYSDLGFLGCDLAGFPNGRRVTDDVVDIALTVAEGAIDGTNALSLQTCDVSGETPVVVNEGTVVNDGALPSTSDYLAAFPYLNSPAAGSP